MLNNKDNDKRDTKIPTTLLVSLIFNQSWNSDAMSFFFYRHTVCNSISQKYIIRNTECLNNYASMKWHFTTNLTHKSIKKRFRVLVLEHYKYDFNSHDRLISDKILSL